MKQIPKYIDWCVEETNVTLEDGAPIVSYKLDYEIIDDVCDELALHIRQHYESDDELVKSLADTKLQIEEYLRHFVVPQKDDPFGPTARSNDFTEIMVSDLLEFVHEYTVPRCKQRNRSGKNQSEHGTDILAYRYAISPQRPSIEDELLAVEVKAGLSSSKYDPIVDAVVDSHKYDEVRHALTLNFYRKHLRHLNDEQAKEIARFQQKSEYDFIITYVGAAVISREEIDDDIVIGIKGEDLKLQKNNKVFLVHGKRLMDLAHEIFERCVK